MSEIGSEMLAELRRIRIALEAQSGAKLGFGRSERVYLFVNHEFHKEGGRPSYWYFKRKDEAREPIFERDLSAYLHNLTRRERADQKPVLELELQAEEAITLQVGFYTNFAISLLAALSELEQDDLKRPLTLLVEPSEGKNSRPTLFCRVLVGGRRLNPSFSKDTDVKALFLSLCERFGFDAGEASDE